MSSTPSTKQNFPVGWVLLFAVLAAYALEDFKAAWLGALAGWLCGRVLGLERQIEALHERLRELDLRLFRREHAGPPPQQAEAARAAIPDVSTTASVAVEPAASPRVMPRMSPGWSATPPTDEAVLPTPPRSRTPGFLDPIEAWFKRGNPIAQLGVLITFFGAVFLIKYAAAEGYLPIEWRLGGLAVGALAMVVTGWRLREKASVYVLTLQGGGLALLYLTVLAAFRFYALLPSAMAITLLAIVAAASAALAVRQNALALAVIGFSGGFVAPLLIGGHGSHIALFGYYTVLNLGVFAIAAYRAWSVLNLLGFVFTFVITALWRATRYQPDLFASTEFFLLLFFALYVGVTVLNARNRSPDLRSAVSGTLTFGLPAIVLSLQASIVRDDEYGLAWSAFGFGLFYLLLAGALHASKRETLRLPKQAFIAIGVVLLSLAVPLRYDEQATAATWALEGAGAVWLGVRQDQRRTRFFGVLIQMLAAISLILSLREIDDTDAALAAGVPGGVLLALAGWLSGYWLYRHHERLAPYERNVDRAFAVWGVGWWLYAGCAQIDHLHTMSGVGLALLFAAMTALLLDLAGARLAWAWLRELARVVLVLFAAFGAGKALIGHPFGEGGSFGWAALLTVHYFLLWRREHCASAEDNTIIARGLHVGALWLLALRGSLELAWQISETRSSDWIALAYGLVPAALLLPITLRQPRWPVAVHDDSYRLWAAPPMAIWLLLWIALNSLFNRGNAAPLPTLPLLNPLDLAIAGTLAVLAIGWQELSAAQRGRLALPQPWLLPAIVAGVVFVWLNSALIRSLHYGFGTPLGEYGIRHSALVQAALSIFWGSLGFSAMLLGARRGAREIWLVGAGLMVVVALKLFLVDTAGTGTLARIAAFLIVGALLLVTGYLAPLPPSRADTGEEEAR